MEKETKEQQQTQSLRAGEVIPQATEDKIQHEILTSEKYVDLQYKIRVRAAKDIRAKLQQAQPELDLGLLVEDCGKDDLKPSRTKVVDSLEDTISDATENQSTLLPSEQAKDDAPLLDHT